LLVTFEGIDGAGKTSLSERVWKSLKESGFDALWVERKRVPEVGGYVESKLRDLRSCLWPSAPEEPQYLLGDNYYLLLTAAWLTALDEQIIIPALKRGAVVLVDGWYFKVLCRNRLRPHVSAELVQGTLSHLSRPNLVVFIDINPELAIMRKGTIGNAESGVNDGYKCRSRENFIAYQERVLACLKDEVRDFLTLHVNGLDSLDTSSSAVCRGIADALMFSGSSALP
jgi:dTMP kinase